MQQTQSRKLTSNLLTLTSRKQFNDSFLHLSTRRVQVLAKQQKQALIQQPQLVQQTRAADFNV